MPEKKLTVAAVQVPISADINENLRHMLTWIQRCADRGAELIHFSETILTGYYRLEVNRMSKIDRVKLAEANARLRSFANEEKVWLAYGSTHFDDSLEKPTNCLYMINPKGEEVCRYDKIFLTDTDFEAYSPGDKLQIVNVKGFKVGLTICFDFRFPELYRNYMKAGTDLVLKSSYQSGGDRAVHMARVAPSTIITRAAENGMYVSASNNCNAPSWFDSMIVKFNGIVMAKARRHSPSAAIATLDGTEKEPFTEFIRQKAKLSIQNRHPWLKDRELPEQ